MSAQRHRPAIGLEGAASVEVARRGRWTIGDGRRLQRVLRRILDDHRAAGALSLALVGDGEIRRLHREYLGVDAPTDVLSFALRDGGGPDGGVLGEVVVSCDTALREAARRGIEPERELALYAIHGTLHLVGFDDLAPLERRRMREAERRYLAVFDAGRLASPPRRAPRRRARRRAGAGRRQGSQARLGR
ncbi:MAG: rRNA maturation RNase YbeY [Planctomycetes bacterium]|nr:rRNA maturation RNase YbeY [Planctomycetota bacterium]